MSTGPEKDPSSFVTVPDGSELVHFKIGGLFRCCVRSALEYVDEHGTPPGEVVIDCKHEAEGNKNLLFRDGVWQWNPP